MRTAVRLLTLALATGSAMPALADCPAANRFSFSFGTAAAATLRYDSSYSYTATNGLGQSQSFTVSFAVNGTASPNTTVGGVSVPAIGNLITDGTVTNNLVIGAIFGARTTSITGATNVVATTLDFGAGVVVRDLAVQINDIDFAANQYRDWMYVSGTSPAGTYVPSIVTPWSTDNGAGAKTNASSSMALGAATTPFSQTANEGVGTGASANNAATGTLTASFVQPVRSATFRYGNYPFTTGENTTGQQAYGIQTVAFCRLPTLTMTKTSAPWSDPQNGTTNPKLTPGADLIYTLTVTNSNDSNLATADLPAITDVLASTLTYYNGDIDDAGPLTTNFEFVPGTSGVTLTGAGVTYSNNGGSTYAYTPSAGYDTNVNALRFAPGGTFAANTSFQLKFRVRIK
ncbi:hypothetical protein [Sphingomonas sp. SUN039]|uniref:hypothetical protein n=1 Tax=Sphingomonas sp. SUN039 TaxID=2937787 RepID=UPI0021647D7B|nr:hypothetical protein [Sphingomonas sp. SUN039]UVO54953.1 hypothetical protein M0209_12760 [Sphingomonas sp. SUN039]